MDGWRWARPVLWSVAFCLTTAGLVAVPEARAAEPVRSIDIYVEPFYRSAKAAGEAPEVHTGKPYAALLASTDRKDILAARDRINADPSLVTPMTLMVLAIRLYDTGERDEAVLWFYIAKERYIALEAVAAEGAPMLQQAAEAVRAFATLAGPVINGYAFCDLARQAELHAKAIDWVEQNPYGAVFLKSIPSRQKDRKAALAAAIADARASAEKERAYLADPGNAASFKATRKQNGADEMFCWK